MLDTLPDRIDALCNVAGVPGTCPPEMVLTVNLLGLRHLTEALVDRLPVGGSVVNVASTAGSEWMSVMEPIFEGTSEIQRLVIARAISGVHIR